MSRDLLKVREPEEMLARARKIVGRDSRINERLLLRKLGR
jgi:hypothetical protein